MIRPRILVALAAAFAWSAAPAAEIVHASYDAAADALVLDIAYRGTHEEHPFEVQWAPCAEGAPAQTVGRLIDLHGRDAARLNLRETIFVPLDRLPCRPVLATLRLGRVSHATLFIPQAP